MYLKVNPVIDNRLHNTKRHRSSSSSNKECQLKVTHHNEVVSSKQLGVPIKYELQQYVVPVEYECHHSRPQNAKRISARSSNLPSQTIPNLRGNASVVTLRSAKEFPQSAPQQLPRSTDAKTD
ncbi:hypothetical protein CR513_54928, partial [Mucuna pruriens]